MKASLSNHTTVVLTGACLLLGVVLAWEASTLDSITVNPPPPPKVEAVPPAPKEFQLPPIEHYQNFVSRPLFTEGRTPLPEEGGSQEVIPASDLPKLQLTGILDTPDAGQIVLMRSQDGKRHYRLHPGDEIEGWHLAEIAPDHVVLEQGGRRQTLQLLKPRPNAPAIRKRPTVRPSPRKRNPFLKKNTKRKSL